MLRFLIYLYLFFFALFAQTMAVDELELEGSPEVFVETPTTTPLPSPSSALHTSPTPSALPATPLSSSIPFTDVSRVFGFQPETEQFGGATIADIDGDGIYDFILTYHNRHPMRIYYGTSNAKFERSPFVLRADIHGVCVGPRTAWSNEKIITVSVGGGRGTNLRPPFIYLTQPDRSISTITDHLGFGQERTRGRIPVFMDMSMKTTEEMRLNQGGPDILFINLIGKNANLKHFAYQNVQGNFTFQDVPGLAHQNEERAIVTDIDGDGVMELVHFSVLKIFKLIAPFTFQDVTKTVWPGFRNLKRSVAAVVELDFNNDGFMDLYIARAQSSLVTPRGPASVPEIGDVLLMNRGGTYVDVSATAGIPQDTSSMGVSAEDFDNDGYIDLIVTTFEGPDIMLLNQGDGTFKQTDPKTNKPGSTRGANVMAVDYDLDGRMDYIVGHGLRKAFNGNFHLMKNEMALTTTSNYLLVRVGNEITRACTSLNAIVTVYLPNNQKLVRRVSGRGAGAGGLSYIDTVHFGLGLFTKVSQVAVKWTSMATEGKLGVDANQVITFGVFN